MQEIPCPVKWVDLIRFIPQLLRLSSPLISPRSVCVILCLTGTWEEPICVEVFLSNLCLLLSVCTHSVPDLNFDLGTVLE